MRTDLKIVLFTSRAARHSYHYDSALNTNRMYARRLALILAESIGTQRLPEYYDANSPRQPNSYMCGDYSCAFVSLLVERFKKGEDPPRTRVDLVPAAQHAKGIRAEIMQLVQQLAEGNGDDSSKK